MDDQPRASATEDSFQERLKSFFRDLPIRRKLNLIVMATSSVSLLLACFVFMAFDMLALRQKMIGDLAVLAESIGINSDAALDFGDRRAAEEILSALQVRPRIVCSAIWDAEGTLFVTYERQGEDLLFPGPEDDFHYFEGNSLHLFRSIMSAQNRIGTVYVRSDLQEFYSRLGNYGVVLLAIVAGCLLLTYFMSSRLQKMISGPILHLAEVERRVQQENDYSVRATSDSRDELGSLIQGFNKMLERIGAHQAHLRVAREKAEEANQIKSAFLASMSHELRTPLNAILGYSEMLMEDAEEAGQDQLRTDLARVHAAGRHLLLLIDDVLDLSKIEAGKLELYNELFPVSQLVEDTTSMIAPLAQKNRNALQVNCPSDFGSLEADPTRVRQVLYNVLSNATKFTENGTIELDVSRSTAGGSEWAIFEITDTGIGMTAEQLDRIFETFYRGDLAEREKLGGTGLGLAISRRLCQMMGGAITARSEFGKGSTFTIRLPQAPKSAACDPAETPDTGRSANQTARPA